MGSDPVKSRSQQNLEAFQSTLPGWGATLRGVVPYLTCYTFQSTLPGWGATIESTGNATDVMIFQSTLPGWGATHNSSLGMVANSQFQSTLPGWGATEARHPTRSPVRYFNPRSPDGERLCSPDLLQCLFDISIHAPRMGSDLSNDCKNSFTPLFQSTLPGWGATKRSDDMTQKILFQSTLPGWGATFSKSTRRKTMTKFQSTLPGWGATSLPVRLPPL